MWVKTELYRNVQQENYELATALVKEKEQTEKLQVEVKKLEKEVKNLEDENHVLKSIIQHLEKKNEELELDRLNPQKIVQKIMGQDIEWFDYHELKPAERLKYYQDAQYILQSRVFENEVKYLISCWAKWALNNSQDFQGVRDMRMSASGIQLLKERLESIENPSVRTATEELASAI